MILYPAIDIKSGNVVRLLQGRFDEMTKYSSDPVAVAKQWESKGAQWLHVVDLDGALQGTSINQDIIIEIAQAINIPVQTGGGLRSKESIEKLINGGVSRVVLGTKAIEDRAFFQEALSQWKEKIAVSLDCNNGMVAQRGWTTTSDIKATDFVKELEELGVQCIIYTDIARDGTLTGPNLDGLKQLLDTTSIPIIASGGISNLDDIQNLKRLEGQGVVGAITGKAIYEGKFQLEDALKLC